MLDLELTSIASVRDPLFADASRLLERSFEADERREWDAALFDNRFFNLGAVLSGGKLVAFLSSWHFDEFVLVEHLAVDEDLGKGGLRGLGGAVVAKFVCAHPGLVVGECERPVTKTGAKRIRFFERLGFFVNPFDYVQPSYSTDKSPVPMLIVSHPRGIGEEEYKNIRCTIYREVYGRVGPVLDGRQDLLLQIVEAI